MILYVNVCVRRESRTNRLAAALLRQLGGAYEEVRLAEEPPAPLSAAALDRRTALIEAGDFSDPMFRHARQFQAADVIVIAAPYWDLSFPAVLKTYLENVYVTGLVSVYGTDGTPRGLCRAKKALLRDDGGRSLHPRFRLCLRPRAGDAVLRHLGDRAHQGGAAGRRWV